MASAMLLAALDAAGRGIAVLPGCWPDATGACGYHPTDCPKPGKRPLISRRYATTDASVIRRWYSRWPLAGLKWVPTGDFIIVDVDVLNRGIETTTRWYLEHGALPPTWADTNGHDAGGHVVLTMPGGTDGKLDIAPGIEVFGRGAEVAMPPSPYYLGGFRAWRPGSSPNDFEVAEAPSWLVSKVLVAQMHQSRHWSSGPLTSEEIIEFEHTFSSVGVEARGRSKGLYRCPFHDDRAPSLSVDWSRGLFNCHASSCDAKGSLHTLRHLVSGVTA